MKILLFGRTGQLGRELNRTLAPLGEVSALGQDELDLVDLKALKYRIQDIKPQLIINASAYTAVDRAEQEPMYGSVPCQAAKCPGSADDGGICP